GLPAPTALRVDGGMVANDVFCQNLADLTGRPIERPQIIETTALGAAYLAGLGVGLYASTAELAERWRIDRRFDPQISSDERDHRYAGWKEAVARVLTKG
ncbi:MAG TPA: glycerol kinase, partial [Alphaproteobacteria bacterium]|nr:glycerol kinase [Alphaproteobacteria bacterium]